MGAPSCIPRIEARTAWARIWGCPLGRRMTRCEQRRAKLIRRSSRVRPFSDRNSTATAAAAPSMAAAPRSPLADAAGLPDSTAPAVTTVASVTVDTTPARVRARLAAAGSAPPSWNYR
jgi:hypothetical protein